MLERRSEAQRREAATKGDLRASEWRLEIKVEAAKAEVKCNVALLAKRKQNRPHALLTVNL